MCLMTGGGARQVFVDLGNYCKFCIMQSGSLYTQEQVFVVFPSDLGQKFPDACSLSRSGRPLQTVLRGLPPRSPGTDLEREFAHLGILEFELLGNVINLQYSGSRKSVSSHISRFFFISLNLYAIGINCIGLLPD